MNDPVRDGDRLEDPVQSPARLKALRDTGLLDSPRDQAFDQLVQNWARMLEVPLALVSLVDSERQFFKARVGLIPEPYASARETPLSHSFCKYVVASGMPFFVNDSREHPLVRGNLAIIDLGFIAYAGLPFVTPDGHVLGALCFIDSKPREWNLKGGSIIFRPSKTRDK